MAETVQGSSRTCKCSWNFIGRIWAIVTRLTLQTARWVLLLLGSPRSAHSHHLQTSRWVLAVRMCRSPDIHIGVWLGSVREILVSAGADHVAKAWQHANRGNPYRKRSD